MEPSDPHTPGTDHRRPSGISPQTLIIASVASAAASFTVARVWGPGTLIGAAAAPVIVALVAETLRRPMRRATATAKRVPTARLMSASRHRPSVPPDGPDLQNEPVSTATRFPSGTNTGSIPSSLAHRAKSSVTLDAPSGRATDGLASGVTRSRPRWRLALATGLLAFTIVVGAFTVPDLITGHSITGNGGPTTFFGSSPSIAKTTTPPSITTVTIITTTLSTKATPRTTTAHSTTTPTAATKSATTQPNSQTASTPSTSTTATTTSTTTSTSATPITAAATNTATATTGVP